MSEETPMPTPVEPDWMIDDTTPGQGARPDWLPAKYKKVADLGRSYTELEKRFGAFTGAPENYDLSALEIDDSQLTIKELTAVAKELNMSQEGFQKILGRLVSAQETEATMHLDEQVKALGKDGERMLVEYKNWTKDYLQAHEQEVVNEWVKTADDLKAFNRIMAHTHMSAVPTTATMNMANQFEGVQELRGELAKNLDRFKTDKAYAKDWQSRMGRAVTRNPNS